MINTSDRLSIVMPVYNEEEIIATVVKDWHDTLTELGIDFEIRCYNDGSKDGTAQILATLATTYPHLVVINKPNTGHGPTILRGYKESEASDWIFQIDSDNEIRADQFARFWELRDDFDFLLGGRNHGDFPVSRQFISYIAWLVVRLGFGSKLVDVNSPFRLFRSEAVSPLIQRIPADTFAPNVLITGMVGSGRLRWKEMPVENRFRETGTVSIKHFKLFKVALRSFNESISFVLRNRRSM